MRGLISNFNTAKFYTKKFKKFYDPATVCMGILINIRDDNSFNSTLALTTE